MHLQGKVAAGAVVFLIIALSIVSVIRENQRAAYAASLQSVDSIFVSEHSIIIWKDSVSTCYDVPRPRKQVFKRIAKH